MAIRKKTSTTKLPQSLLEQIEGTDTNIHGQQPNHRRSKSVSRKDARKQERSVRKQRKANFFSHSTESRSTANSPETLKRSAEREHEDAPRRKKAKTPSTQPKPLPLEKAKANANSTQPASTSGTSGNSKSRLEKLSAKRSVPQPRSRLEEDEDNYIAYLEAQLGVKKAKKGKVSDEDGLEELLSYADTIVGSTIASDLLSFVVRILTLKQESKGFPDEIEEPSEESSDDEEEWGGITPASPQESTAPLAPEPQSDQVAASTHGRYVPPHLRDANAKANPSEEQQKLMRHLKGLLNRMSEQNISSIIGGVEELYREYRRHDVTSTLTSLIIASISNHSSLLDSFVVVYAAFVSSLHKLVGIDFAAYFVQQTVSSYEQHYELFQAQASRSDAAQGDSEGKECSNLLVLLSELYNFQVVSSVIVFDFIRALLDGDLLEFNVELLLKLLRNSGQQLRQDDPSALKDIVNIVQTKVGSQGGDISSRTSFMVETLTNLKNNKIKKSGTQNQGGAAVERMKKFLTNLSKTKHVLAHEPLRVSLADLHSADSKGKWWIVGAAWGGDPLVDKQAELARSTSKVETESPDVESAELLKLAKAQGMNTDVRRGIFVVLMSSEDYVDACERLSQLHLNDVQQREIIRVLFHCCGNERMYNPYYTLVSQQLCRTSHGHKITLQYCIWDFLRDLGESNVGGAAVVKNAGEGSFDLKSISESRLSNVAKAYAWWIAKDSVSLLIFKPVDFTTLKPRSRTFLKEIFRHIFVSSQRSTPLISSDISKLTLTRNRNVVEEIFIKASRVQGLAMGLVYFLTEAFKADSAADDPTSKFFHWAVEVAKETLRTGIDLVPSL